MRGKKEQGKNNVNFFFDIYSLRNFEMGGGGSLAGCGHPSVLLLACSLNTIDFQHEGKFVYSTQKIIIISIILFLPPHTLSLSSSSLLNWRNSVFSLSLSLVVLLAAAAAAPYVRSFYILHAFCFAFSDGFSMQDVPRLRLERLAG